MFSIKIHKVSNSIKTIKTFTLNEDINPKMLKSMSKSKRSHSKRVAQMVSELTSSRDVYEAAYYHDYLEQIGKKKKLRKILSYYSYQLVSILSHSETKDPLTSLQINYLDLDSTIKSDASLIKICDRIDNLNKRYRNNNLKSSYLKKSKKLFKFLFQECQLPPEQLKSFIHQQLLFDIKIS